MKINITSKQLSVVIKMLNRKLEIMPLKDENRELLNEIIVALLNAKET